MFQRCTTVERMIALHRNQYHLMLVSMPVIVPIGSACPSRAGDYIDDKTLRRASKVKSLFLCMAHRLQYLNVVRDMLADICKDCERTILPKHSRYIAGEIPFVFYFPCKACMKLQSVLFLFEIQGTHYIVWRA